MNGAQIEAARKALRMDRTQLGAAVGVSERTIYRWERNDVEIPKPSLTLLGQILKGSGTLPAQPPSKNSKKRAKNAA